MDQKKGPNRRSKRQSKLVDDCYWDCSVCTYRNSAEAFKCLMCDIRKGTSTRKPRINPQLVAQQVAQQYTQTIPKIRKEESPVLKTEMGMPNLPDPSPPPPPLPPAVVVPLPAPRPERLQPPKLEKLPVPKPEKLPIPKPERLPAPKPERAEKRNGTSCEGRKSRKARPKLKNVDRSSAQHKAVTVNNVTVIITEFQPKRHQSSSSSSELNNCLPPIGNRHGPAPPQVNGCGAAENGNHSDSTNLSNDLHSDGRSS